MGNSPNKPKLETKVVADNGFRPNNVIGHTQTETEQHLAALAQIKERRRVELLAFEEQQSKRIAEEAQLKSSLLANHNKFLIHITESQKELESRLAEVHQEKEFFRQQFSEQLCRTEAEMEASINDVLENIRAHRDQNQLQELVKSEETQSQSLLTLKLEEFKTLRKEDILSAMKSQLEQDIDGQKANQNKTLFLELRAEDDLKNRQIEEILQHRKKDQAVLVMGLLQEESWQYQAFSSLLAQRDRRITQLNEDIRIVIDQLNQLTNWELDRKRKQMDVTNSALAENRSQLAELLSQLIEQQQSRRKGLKQLLEEMEAQRKNQAEDYWLVQYQRLMDNIPHSIATNQKCIPSAPCSTFEDRNIASAPPVEVFVETTCVVCFDNTCQVIFLPCGHLCCCGKCGESLNQCPMCRTAIVQRLQILS